MGLYPRGWEQVMVELPLQAVVHQHQLSIYPCIGIHSSSKATKNELSCPDEIPLQMLPMGIWGPENMKIENI